MNKDYLAKGKKFWFWPLIGVVFLGVCSVGMPLSEASDYPTKGVNVIVAWAAGGAQDTITRLLTVRLAKKWGVPVSVINKPGGLGIPGTLEVLQSAPDGYTILSETSATSSSLDAWGKNVPFNIKDRTYLASATEYAFGICVRADTGWKTLADLEEAVNQNPSSIRWGWLGGIVGGTDVVAIQSLVALTKKIDVAKVKQIRMITYRGGGEILPAMAGGHIDVNTPGAPQFLPLTSTGKARLLAVADSKRSPRFPDVPTTAEQGWPNVKSLYWIGFSGPMGLPPNVVQAWEKGIQDVLKDPSLKTDLEKFETMPSFKNGEDLRKFVLNEAKEIKALPVFK